MVLSAEQTLAKSSIDAGGVTGFQKLTVGVAAVGLTVPAGSSKAVVAVESNAVRYRIDGTNPTATDGMPLAAGTTVVIVGALASLKLIRQSADATLQVTYFKEP